MTFPPAQICFTTVKFGYCEHFYHENDQDHFFAQPYVCVFLSNQWYRIDNMRVCCVITPSAPLFLFRFWSNRSRSFRQRWWVNIRGSWWQKRCSRWPDRLTWVKLRPLDRTGPQRKSPAAPQERCLTAVFRVPSVYCILEQDDPLTKTRSLTVTVPIIPQSLSL